jgi:hypothetical protein
VEINLKNWSLVCQLFSFCVDQVLAVSPPIFARCPIFQNQSSHVENRTEPASQIPEEGRSTNP